MNRLSQKEKGFVNDVADGMVPTQAALKNYDTESYGTAGVIAHENLKKPKIIDALAKKGFDAETAKNVVSEILIDETVEPKDRLKAAEIVFKVTGDFAPEKHLVVTRKIISVDE